MDEIVVAQNKYISSKRASRLTGYAQDYIGQLVRLGKVNATKVGKAWFVDEAALMRHINGSNRLPGPIKELAAVETKSRSAYVSGVTAGISYPATWGSITYMQDDSPLIPISGNRDRYKNNDFIENDIRKTDDTSRVRISVSRAAEAKRQLVSARSIDGVRFEAPRTNFEPLEAEIRHIELDFQTKQHLLGETSLTSSTSFSTRLQSILLSAVIVAALVFFVPLVV